MCEDTEVAGVIIHEGTEDEVALDETELEQAKVGTLIPCL
jgi:hypothetical protein